MDAALQVLVERVRDARSRGARLRIVGGDTKSFYGSPVDGEPLDVRPLAGIASHEPTELVVTVRGGTPLAELEAALARHGQWLPFEPPRFAPGGTVGGMVAAGLAGPGRAAAGGVRDFVLGATLLNGRAELLSFGGQVMKNVAGYDVSRVLAGSMGVLGVICEVSLKVLPQPVAQATLRFEQDQAGALHLLNTWGGQPLPITASAWWDGALVVRLAGAAAAVRAARSQLGGELIDPALATAFWTGLRDHGDEFFAAASRAVESGATLWRLSLPSIAMPLQLAGEQLVEWGGAQRWLCSDAPAEAVVEAAAAAGGHAVRFRSADRSRPAFAPLSGAMLRVQRDVKRAFDPDGVFNPGRLGPEL